MIRSAILKLTLAYLAIFMALSISFSAVLYRLSSSELDHSLRRTPSSVFALLPDSFDYEQFRQDRLDEGLHNLLVNLFVLNMLMFAIGAGTSYFLALRTLEPIAEAMEMESRFTADASHELRTPLTAMQTEIEVALRDPKLTKEEAKNLLKSNLEEVAKLRDLSAGLLKLAQGDMAQEDYEDVPMADILTDACREVKTAAAAKDISISKKLAKGQVHGDQQNLKELFVILLDNAVKYSDPKTSIELTSELAGHHYIAKVADHGHGIAEKDLQHIFERFYRADNSRSKDKADGYGLGLSIAKHIVEAHHGHINVTSQEGSGTVITAQFPALIPASRP